MISLESNGIYTTTDGETVFTFSDDRYTDLDMKILMRKKRTILVDGEKYKIKAVEFFPTSNSNPARHSFGLLVKPAE